MIFSSCQDVVPFLSEFTSPDESRRLVIGTVYVALACISIPTSVFVLSVFTKKELLTHSCYKFLTITSILDVTCLTNAALFSGLLTLLNLNPCNGHAWTFVFAYFAPMLWYTYCAASEVLSLNRMLFFVNDRLSNFLFKGKRTWLWLIYILSYPIICAQFHEDGMFYVYDPYSGLIYDGKPYHFHAITNFSKLGTVSAMYIIMVIAIFWKMHKSGSSSTLKHQINISLQTLLVAFIGDACATFYILAQSIIVGPYLGFAAQLSWIFLHLSTGLVYLIANKKVRDSFLVVNFPHILRGRKIMIFSSCQEVVPFLSEFTSPDESRRLVIGTVYVALGCISIPTSVFVLSVFIKKELLTHSCYKVLTITSILDVTCLTNAALFSGLLTLLNLNPCNGHAWTFVFAYFAPMLWYTYCAASEVLSLNRMLFFVNDRLSNFLFKGKRTWLWLIYILSYPIICAQFHEDGMFYVYDPYSGLIYDGKPYHFHAITNFSKLGTVSVMYIIMVMAIFWKMHKSGSSSTLKHQINISLQTLLVAFVGDASSSFYILVQYIIVGPYLGFAAQLAWISLHLSTGLVYLIANKKVRDSFLNLLGRLRSKTCCAKKNISALSMFSKMISTTNQSSVAIVYRI
ncbi:hypothetical protein QR680_015592 [Steinernema hermaphroditum]|uniref:Serpentine receptor class gamma n=1 Tax=Steinernema hermaphroditum TaxID=289476 RepID=A0AA39H9A8_9BILA|nr:hypothetical protein QR680_015592 [Steinernema hermaphroditum]